MQEIYVIGGAQTDFSRNWSKEGKNVLTLLTKGYGYDTIKCTREDTL